MALTFGLLYTGLSDKGYKFSNRNLSGAQSNASTLRLGSLQIKDRGGGGWTVNQPETLPWQANFCQGKKRVMCGRGSMKGWPVRAGGGEGSRRTMSRVFKIPRWLYVSPAAANLPEN